MPRISVNNQVGAHLKGHRRLQVFSQPHALRLWACRLVALTLLLNTSFVFAFTNPAQQTLLCTNQGYEWVFVDDLSAKERQLTQFNCDFCVLNDDILDCALSNRPSVFANLELAQSAAYFSQEVVLDWSHRRHPARAPPNYPQTLV